MGQLDTPTVEKSVLADKEGVRSFPHHRCEIVSIGHRSTLMVFHDRHLAVQPEGDHHRIRDAVLGQSVSHIGAALPVS
jgi:hypothetical protein